MNKRLYDLILLIYENPNKHDISEIAEKLSLTARTVRSDLNIIDNFLKKKDMEVIIDDHRKISLTGDLKNLYIYLDHLSFYEYNLSKEERFVVESLILIFTSEHITMSEIAEYLSVSRSTVIADLEELNKILKKHNLLAQGFSNIGIKLMGEELSRRNLYVEISENYPYLLRLFFNQERNILAYERENATTKNIILQNIINESEEITNSYLTEGSFFRLYSYLQLAIFRMDSNEYIEDFGQETTNDFIKQLAEFVFQYFDLKESEAEKQYLFSMVKNIRFFRKTVDNTSMLKIQTITRKFVEKISDDLGQPYYKDYNFFVNLSNHLERIFQEPLASLVEYPEVQLIVESNPRILKSVEDNIHILEEFIGRKVEKAEIDYIVIYVCASHEKLTAQRSDNTVIIVCNSGIGTSHLIKSKIQEHFNFIIKGVFSSHNLTRDKLEGVEFIISTVDLYDVEFPYVKISPLLRDEDYLKLREMVNKIGKGYLKQPVNSEMTNLIKQIKPLIHEYQGLGEDISKVISSYFKEKESQEFLLEDYLTEDHIEVDVEARDWKEAIAKSSRLLLEKGYFTKNYIDAMIANVEKHGPYIVISQGFALPHAGTEDGTLKTGMSLTRLKNPLPFDAGLLDPIKYICVLSAVDNKTHLKAFFNLVNLLRIKDFHKQLDKAQSSSEIADIIRRYERNLNIGGM